MTDEQQRRMQEVIDNAQQFQQWKAAHPPVQVLRYPLDAQEQFRQGLMDGAEKARKRENHHGSC